MRPIIRSAIALLALLSAAAAQEETLFEYATPTAFKVPGLEIETDQGLGVAWGDYNNDGYPDLFLTELGFRLTLLHNEGGVRFTPRNFNFQTSAADRFGVGGSVWGDYDNDGDLDLHIPRGPACLFCEPTPHPTLLLRNDEGRLLAVTEAAGIDLTRQSLHSIWLDYDHDGFLDLLTTPWSFPDPSEVPSLHDASWRNSLHRNRGDGTFEDATQAAGLDIALSPIIGGSAGGAIAADLNDDGVTDLFLAVPLEPNRLLSGGPDGAFTDITDNEIGIGGQPSGVVVGDIDNDGDLDLFHADGGGDATQTSRFRSRLLLNLGDGTFFDVTEGSGLAEVIAFTSETPVMGDIDNDGDIDLIAQSFSSETAQSIIAIFLNDGDGTFTDATARSGMAGPNRGTGLADYDRDGFLDVLFSIDGDKWDEAFPEIAARADRPLWANDLGKPRRGTVQALYRNRGNDNRYLRVELAGVQSNRNGIGARLFATTGDKRQRRDILGGNGYNQDEMVAHFGLGQSDRVDRLEVHWPSGQVDLLSDIPANSSIRVVEGSSQWHPARPTTWTHNLPDTLQVGATLAIDATVRPALFDAGARVTAVTADLSAFGGEAAVALVDQGDGSYALRRSLTIEGPGSVRELNIAIRQESAAGPYWTGLSKTVSISAGDLGQPIFADALAPDWRLENRGSARVEAAPADRIRTGEAAQAITLNADTVLYVYDAPRPLPDGRWLFPQEKPGQDWRAFTHLSFWLHSGEAVIDSLFVDVGHETELVPDWRVPVRVSLPGTLRGQHGELFSLLYDFDGGRGDLLEILRERDMRPVGVRYLDMDLGGAEWIPVHVPVDSLTGFEAARPVRFVRFSGQVEGTLFIDDLRLTRNPEQTATAVLETYDSTAPASFTLNQNYPNPFNSRTVIPFALPKGGKVELAVFNLAGQKVATLLKGYREAGQYKITWDGRDDAGRGLATGMYLYQLDRGDRRIKTQKLLLLR